MKLSNEFNYAIFCINHSLNDFFKFLIMPKSKMGNAELGNIICSQLHYITNKLIEQRIIQLENCFSWCVDVVTPFSSENNKIVFQLSVRARRHEHQNYDVGTFKFSYSLHQGMEVTVLRSESNVSKENKI